MLSTIGAVAAGGALGAVMRYGINITAPLILGHGFPFATFFVNVTGSFLVGVLVGLFAHLGNPGEVFRAFAITGFLGAFTTFSAFSLDILTLYERGEIMQAGVYVLSSVALSIAAIFAGIMIVRIFAS